MVCKKLYLLRARGSAGWSGEGGVEMDYNCVHHRGGGAVTRLKGNAGPA